MIISVAEDTSYLSHEQYMEIKAYLFVEEMILTGVGICNFIGFIWIEPDFLFATLEHTGSKPFLKAKSTAIKK